MSRKPREDVRKKILDAAESLFAQKGFDATGIELIAKTAGITKSLIYYYFKSKDEILSDLFSIFVKKSVEMKQTIIEKWMAEPTIGIDKIVRQYSLPFMMENKKTIKIAFIESVKDVQDVPHLNFIKYFDENFNAGYEIARKMGLKTERSQDQMLGAFFLLFAPLFSFVIFSDEWCEHYDTDLDTISDYFADAFGKMYSVFMREKVSTTNLKTMLEERSES